MSIVLVCGMGTESSLIGDKSTRVIQGTPATIAVDLEAAIVAGGVTHILSWGTCGALDPALPAGSLVVYRSVMGGNGDRVTADGDWTSALATLTGAVAVAATAAPDTVFTAAAKAALFACTGASVVDLESYTAASIAAAHGLPCAGLRAVSDAADQDIPPAALDALTKTGDINAWAAISGAFLNPSELPALMALDASSQLAFSALARAEADVGPTWGLPCQAAT